ncbi:hypothetical protein M409DRAFT_55043 [Zasmidium cellare ATCC 36951]|uniref:Uncharacterized protein n=1 Tax=Zasmidium cellare ATCC 36951 TaxID=1080233 RepID=A0A6A6CHS0_ZASCE|nr:uncharacterized protein M409DRAFT_55043 [Zasmidium cellare ATCC 36951]KAF2166173.1 hypothetical protein M409DRAFT_55043 [Zasmidium cellare ATCC 36951]
MDDNDNTDTGSLIDLYELCQVLDDTAAMDAIVSVILALYLEHGGSTIGREKIERVYNITEPDWPLRRAVVDTYVWIQDPVSVEYYGTVENEQFVVGLAKALIEENFALKSQSAGSEAIDKVDYCDYHHHEKDAPCPTKSSDIMQGSMTRTRESSTALARHGAGSQRYDERELQKTDYHMLLGSMLVWSVHSPKIVPFLVSLPSNIHQKAKLGGRR